MCKGSLENQVTSFMTDIDNRYYIIKDVPAQVCRQCGEVSYSHEIAKRLEKLIKGMKPADTEVMIASFAPEIV
jgi:YgiT-type zinc finger domain-containing protein